ncbi:hypothetical protein CDAR_180541 [Caerostris darwini]|uniref:Uncharacterized protein n=1 Tax=Caerostris darwini TaxID=1538125 RepID=A0AAV4UGM6_9ARAC|nr:hypothetical protein CDAR_180541 [Caerostris darwini]
MVTPVALLPVCLSSDEARDQSKFFNDENILFFNPKFPRMKTRLKNRKSLQKMDSKKKNWTIHRSIKIKKNIRYRYHCSLDCTKYKMSIHIQLGFS